jgi:hypothetical protein
VPQDGQVAEDRRIQPVSLNRVRQKPHVNSQRAVRSIQRRDLKDSSNIGLIASIVSWGIALPQSASPKCHVVARCSQRAPSAKDRPHDPDRTEDQNEDDKHQKPSRCGVRTVRLGVAGSRRCIHACSLSVRECHSIPVSAGLRDRGLLRSGSTIRVVHRALKEG